METHLKRIPKVEGEKKSSTSLLKDIIMIVNANAEQTRLDRTSPVNVSSFSLPVKPHNLFDYVDQQN